jgi:hypothetical protein
VEAELHPSQLEPQAPDAPMIEKQLRELGPSKPSTLN